MYLSRFENCSTERQPFGVRPTCAKVVPGGLTVVRHTSNNLSRFEGTAALCRVCFCLWGLVVRLYIGVPVLVHQHQAEYSMHDRRKTLHWRSMRYTYTPFVGVLPCHRSIVSSFGSLGLFLLLIHQRLMGSFCDRFRVRSAASSCVFRNYAAGSTFAHQRYATSFT